jgi:SpoVK/Ycf46/Vps4 family AAA+-type ATPase
MVEKIDKTEKKDKSEKKETTKATTEIVILIEKKMLFFQDVIQKTILHVQKNKMLDIVSVSEVHNCINSLYDLNKIIKDIPDINGNTNIDNIINILQTVNNELSSLFKQVGTDSFEDLLWICFGNNSVNTYAISDMDKHKFELLKKYFHPTSYKILGQKKSDNKSNKTEDDVFTEKSKNLDTADVSIKIKQFHLKVYGIQIIVHNLQHNKSLIISGIIDDIMTNCLNNKFINLNIKAIRDNIPQTTEFQGETFNRFLQSLNLKDYFIFEPHEIYSKYVGYLNNLNVLNQKTLHQSVKEFITADLFMKRSTIIQLLLTTERYDNQYLAYLLYDLLSNDTNGHIDTQDQIKLFDSLPWSIKLYFKDAMRRTVEYTNELSNYDMHKLPLEQQICLLKVPDSVKEKAMQKLKEVKAKSEDSGSKARQYLDGLLKIPFNIYKKEPIMNIMDDIRLKYINALRINNISNNTIKDKYTSLEILRTIADYRKGQTKKNIDISNIKDTLKQSNKQTLIEYILKMNDTIQKLNLKQNKIIYVKKTKQELLNSMNSFIDKLYTDNLYTDNVKNNNVLTDIFGDAQNLIPLTNNINEIAKRFDEINTYMSNVKNTLDNAIHGHDKAKKQIERIIGQWINGKQDGYCFGFEGPPGIGKTSLAKKGLSACLKDDKGNSRPFAMIQMGGDANGSSLHGHNYTYVGSTWGSIVQILIDKKCMNPIIFIDEIDKISKTEHGKEIIGILTHLLDPAQNECFQDKYFSGIDLDLSKALFILSYNDADKIDKILLDRVHRISFKSLSLEEKLVISKSHILPEIYDKFGLQGMIIFSNEVLTFVIDEYTSESGVRKLKELLFEIVAEINLNILKTFETTFNIPINITIEDIKTIYLKDKRETLIRKVRNKTEVGFVNGMYATSLGTGGTLPIHAKYFPSDKFLDLKLTGLQQDVMKESMHVALTVAWNLTELKIQTELRNKYDVENHKCGINIHTGDNAVSKDGPSGGCAITCALYSLLNGIPVKPEFGITGEIQMSGEVTAIGGLNYKILGSLKSNVKSFIFPKENEKDFRDFYEKYKDSELLVGVHFYPISNVEEALELLLDK